MIAVPLQYVDDCPTWQTGRDRLLDAIDRLGRDLLEVDLRLITGYQQAVLLGPAHHPAADRHRSHRPRRRRDES